MSNKRGRKKPRRKHSPPEHRVLLANALQNQKDLSKVWLHFSIFLLTDETQCANRHPQCTIVAQAFLSQINGESPNWEQICKEALSASVAATTRANNSLVSKSHFSLPFNEMNDCAISHAAEAALFAANSHHDATELAAKSAAFAAAPNHLIAHKQASIAQAKKITALLRDIQ